MIGCIAALLGFVLLTEQRLPKSMGTYNSVTVYGLKQIEIESNFQQKHSSQQSLEIVFLTCNSPESLQRTVASTFFYNTKLPKKIYICQYCLEPSQLEINKMRQQYSKIILPCKMSKQSPTIFSIEELSKFVEIVFKKAEHIAEAVDWMLSNELSSDFAMVLGHQWHVVAPFGFVERAIDAITACQEQAAAVELHPQSTLKNPRVTKKRTQHFLVPPQQSLTSFIIKVQAYRNFPKNYTAMSKAAFCATSPLDYNLSCLLNNINIELSLINKFSLILGGSHPRKVVGQQQITYEKTIN